MKRNHLIAKKKPFKCKQRSIVAKKRAKRSSKGNQAKQVIQKEILRVYKVNNRDLFA